MRYLKKFKTEDEMAKFFNSYKSLQENSILEDGEDCSKPFYINKNVNFQLILVVQTNQFHLRLQNDLFLLHI
jgi:hypothetical protein